MKEKFDVTGMSCAACAAGIDKKLRKLDGVKDLGVDLIGEKMWVDFDETKVDPSKIISTVEKIGFGASVREESPVKENPTEKDTPKEDKADLPSEKLRLIFSFPFMLAVFYLAMGDMLRLPFPEFFRAAENSGLMTALQLLFTVPVVFLNRKYYIVGFRALKNMVPNMDSLVALSSIASIVYSLWSTFGVLYYLPRNIEMSLHYTHALYYDSAAMILTLVTFGKYLEAQSKIRTRSAMESLVKLAPNEAVIIEDGKEKTVSIENIKSGDVILIKPGEKIPIDGVVIEGISAVDESVLTGEPIPKEKSEGSEVLQGTTNTSGSFRMRATNVGYDTALAQIVKLMEDTQASKAPIARLADKVAAIFVPGVIGISLLSFAVWWFVQKDFVFAMKIAISVLVISCPCALGLATPVAITVAVGKLSKEGVLIKSAEILEELYKINSVVLDKTGTLTEGHPKITELHPVGISSEELLTFAASLEKPSSHPLASAIVREAEGLSLFEVKDFSQVAGRGVRGKIDEVNFYGGNFSFMKDLGVDAQEKKGTVMYFAKEREFLGYAVVKDELRNESKEAVNDIKSLGISISLLTGDTEESALSMKETLNLDDAKGAMLPKDKADFIKEKKERGEKILFAGDGINDALALTQADIGVAVSHGTDIAMESAQVILMNDNLKLIPRTISYSREAFKIIKQNLFFAFIYNIIGIPIAAGILYPWKNILLSPMIGAFCMALSSVSVNLNALRLTRK